MQITFAALADAANIGEHGKLKMLGMFRVLFTEGVPTTSPSMTLVCILRCGPDEFGVSTNLRITLFDPDGVVVTEIGPVPLKMPEPPSDVSAPNPDFTMVLQLNGMLFPKFGPHVFRIETDNTAPHDLPLEIMPAAVRRLV
jgi:hypothetical protein